MQKGASREGRSLSRYPRQDARFGRYQEDPSRRDLERFFFLDDADLLLVDRRRADHVRLGFALQLTTVRFLGTFLSDPLDAPWQVVDYPFFSR